MIIKDISKITALKSETINSILEKIQFKKEIPEDELIEKNLFINNKYRKIKKKLIYEIIFARIKEFSQIILYENINLKFFTQSKKIIFLEVNNKLHLQSLSEIYKDIFSIQNLDNNKLFRISTSESLLNTAHKLVHFGWKKKLFLPQVLKKHY